MKEGRELQFDIIEKIKISIKRFAKDNKIRLHNIETLVPFVDSDFGLHVVFFFDTNFDLNTYNTDGMSTWLKESYLEELKRNKYPEAWLKKITFEFDSYENVVKKYDGNYFYRMR